MQKVKPYLIGLAIVIFLSAVGSAKLFYSKYLTEKAQKERLCENQEQLLAQNTGYSQIKQTLEEFKKTMSAKVDSILTAEKIKPRQVTNVVERHYFYRDTSYNTHSPQPVITPSGEIFPFTDIKDCFKIEGYMQMKDLRPSVTITGRQFENNSVDISYIKRAHKFWFISYGKWKAKLKSVNQCGENTTKEIEVIKE
jgi:hypothetical protein